MEITQNDKRSFTKYVENKKKMKEFAVLQLYLLEGKKSRLKRKKKVFIFSSS